MKLDAIAPVFVALVLCHVAAAATIHVPQDYPTIQAGIDAAVAGDTVLVAPGPYRERIDFEGKAITVASTGGPGLTVIDGHLGAPVVAFVASEGRDSVLQGFTVTNGLGTFSGAGILCSGSSPTIRGNRIVHNVCHNGGWGGGLWCDSSPLIEDNLFLDNHSLRGAAIYSVGTAIVRDNVISDNHCDHGEGGGIYAFKDTIDHNAITWNSAETGGGITCPYPATVTNNVISYNRSDYEGGGINAGIGGGMLIMNNELSYNRGTQGAAIYRGQHLVNNLVHHNQIAGEPPLGGAVWGSKRVENTTIVDNAAPPGTTGGYEGEGKLVSCILRHNTVNEIGGTPTVSYSDVAGFWPGVGNIDADPQFVDRDANDYSLMPTSPCIEAGDPNSSRCDQDLAGSPRLLDGLLSGHATVDMGAFELDHVHLAVSGSPAPGGTIKITTTGTAGLRVLLLVGLAAGESCVPPYGTLFFSLTGTWTSLPWGTIPSAVDVVIPPDVSVPLTVIVQEIALAGQDLIGDTSNPVTLVIQ